MKTTLTPEQSATLIAKGISADKASKGESEVIQTEQKYGDTIGAHHANLHPRGHHQHLAEIYRRLRQICKPDYSFTSKQKTFPCLG